MDKLDKIENNMIDIGTDLVNHYQVLKQVESTYLKELLSDNIRKSYLLIKCIKSILTYTFYLQSNKRKIDLIVTSIEETIKEFDIPNESLSMIINDKNLDNCMKILDEYFPDKEKYFIDINYELIDLAIHVLKKEYSAIQDNLKIIIGDVLDFIPSISMSKQIIEIIKDVATCVNNLDKQQKYYEEIRIIDTGLHNIELENEVLTKVLNFLLSYNFVQEYFDKSPKDFK